MDNKKSNTDRLLELVSDKKSTYLQEMQWRQDNAYWLESSQRISVKILMYLREEGMLKEDLESLIGFSLDLKGKYDWRLSELLKIELETGLKLI